MGQSDLLLIRDQQLRVLGLHARDLFQERLLTHVEGVFPAHSAFVRAPAGRRFLEGCVAAAENHGLTDQHSIALYTDLCIALGATFETEPAYQWISEILRDPGLGGPAKVFLIYNELPQRCPADPLPPPDEAVAAEQRQPLVKLWPAGDWG